MRASRPIDDRVREILATAISIRSRSNLARTGSPQPRSAALRALERAGRCSRSTPTASTPLCRTGRTGHLRPRPNHPLMGDCRSTWSLAEAGVEVGVIVELFVTVVAIVRSAASSRSCSRSWRRPPGSPQGGRSPGRGGGRGPRRTDGCSRLTLCPGRFVRPGHNVCNKCNSVRESAAP